MAPEAVAELFNTSVSVNPADTVLGAGLRSWATFGAQAAAVGGARRVQVARPGRLDQRLADRLCGSRVRLRGRGGAATPAPAPAPARDPALPGRPVQLGHCQGLLSAAKFQEFCQERSSSLLQRIFPNSNIPPVEEVE